MPENPGADDRAAECLLIREDGTRWTVEELELSRRRFRVTARRRAEAEAEAERLASEPLTATDELRWLNDEGEEVARIRGAEG